MKIQKNKKKISRKSLVLALLLLLLVLVGAGAYTYIQSRNNSIDTPSLTHPLDKDKPAHTESNPDTKQQYNNTDKPPTPAASEEISGQQRVQMEASFEKSDDTLFIRGGINYPVSGGRCFATLTGPSGQTVTKDTTLLQSPASTDCRTISIPLSELVSGKWLFTLQYESDTYIGASDGEEISI